MGPYLGAGIKKKLPRRIRKDHGSGVTSLGYDATAAIADFLLQTGQGPERTMGRAENREASIPISGVRNSGPISTPSTITRTSSPPGKRWQQFHSEGGEQFRLNC